MTYTDIKPYKLWEAGFTNSTKLKRPILTKTGKNPYICTTFNDRFTHNDNSPFVDSDWRKTIQVYYLKAGFLNQY